MCVLIINKNSRRRIAKYLQELQRICKEQNFLTSGVEAHLGGLGGRILFSPIW